MGTQRYSKGSLWLFSGSLGHPRSKRSRGLRGVKENFRMVPGLVGVSLGLRAVPRGSRVYQSGFRAVSEGFRNVSGGLTGYLKISEAFQED